MDPEASRAPLKLWIIGPGRVGFALARALDRADALHSLSLTGRRPRPQEDPSLREWRASVTYSGELSLPVDAPDGLLITVPDDTIAGVAASLGRSSLPEGLPILHTSGALGSGVLGPLRGGGSPVGSLHPLLAIADPLEGAASLNGAWFAVEGDAAAVEFARGIVDHLDGRVLPVHSEAKPLYHAAAVFASNYVVALLATAERLARQAGTPPELARAALGDLARSAVRAVGEAGPVRALTGPISRGDAQTLLLHVERLSGPDRALYSELARATLDLARERGLRSDPVETVVRSLLEAP